MKNRYIHYWTWGAKFSHRDIWVGACWNRYHQAIKVEICLVPMVLIGIYVQWYSAADRRAMRKP